MGISSKDFAAICGNMGLDPMRYLGEAETPKAPGQRASIHPVKTNLYAPYKSKVEFNYASHLCLLVKLGIYKDWKYEKEKWRLGHACFYSPDFWVLLPDDSVEWHETKGRQIRKRKDGSTEVSFWAPPKNWQKLKIAAAKWPDRELFVVFPEDRGMTSWKKQRVPTGGGDR